MTTTTNPNKTTTTTNPNKTTTTNPNKTTTTNPTPTPTPTTNTNTHIDNSLVISYYLLKHCKLWVWDFDDTLIDTKYYYKSNMEPDAIIKRTDAELTREVPQWRYFKRLVIYLVSRGKYVGIASFGTYEIIQAYMNRILGFNQTFFNSRNIIAPIYKDRVCRRFQAPPNKNEYIYKIMKLFKINDFKSIVLFDDLPSNIADAIGIGIIGIQIATPNNGDKIKNSDGGDKYASGGVSNSGGSGNGNGDSNFFFGPWLMDEFDQKIVNGCGKELYLNRTYTGITNRYYQNRKKSKAHKDSKDSKDSKAHKDSMDNVDNVDNVDNEDNEDTPYKGLSYDKTNFRNGVHESFLVPAAFGTGIGNRKITMSPEVRWNNMNVRKPPRWINGNWEEATLGGSSLSFWDKHQKVKKSKGDDNDDDDNDNNDNDNDNDDKYVYNNIKPFSINSYNGKLNEAPNYVMGVTEGFSGGGINDEQDFEKPVRTTALEKSRAKTQDLENPARKDSENNDDDDDDDEYDIKSKFGLDEKEKCVSCKKIEWNWIILVLIVIILLMCIIIYNVKG